MPGFTQQYRVKKLVYFEESSDIRDVIAAEKRIKYVAGTMALEEQRPSRKALQEMIEEEKQKLLASETTKIWD